MGQGKEQRRCRSTSGFVIHLMPRASGPSHDATYAAVVRIANKPAGAGGGRSKKAAEASAAEDAWGRRDA